MSFSKTSRILQQTVKSSYFIYKTNNFIASKIFCYHDVGGAGGGDDRSSAEVLLTLQCTIIAGCLQPQYGDRICIIVVVKRKSIFKHKIMNVCYGKILIYFQIENLLLN